jgi:hypothetical protein
MNKGDGVLTFGHIDHTVDLVTSGHRGKRSKGGWWWWSMKV